MEKLRWRVRGGSENKETGNKFDWLPDLVGRVLVLRGIGGDDEARRFLRADYERDLHDPFLFAQMEVVVERLRLARDEQQRIGIYGDYDADGVTGATLLADVFDKLGIETEVYIPHKQKDGHGISARAVEHFAQNGTNLIVTVDCGITNIAEIDAAAKLGMDTIIIDHHHVPEKVPAAVGIINPKAPDSGYPFDGLCGVGAAFKVAQALYQRLAPEQIAQTKWLLDLVAIGTVADMMPLVGENRALVKYGLTVLNKTRRVGLHALFDTAKLIVSDERPASAHTIGFQIAPRLNAAGRMGHAQDAHRLLATSNEAEALRLAADLEKLNDERKKVSQKVTAEVGKVVSKLGKLPAGIIVGDEEFYHGVVGLAAGRIAQKYARPVGVFAHQGEMSKGSFRSAGEVDMMRVLDNCAELLEKFGGHRAAAGATVRRDKFAQFAQKFSEAVEGEFERVGVPDGVLEVDAQLSLSEATLLNIGYLNSCAPFGMANPEPLFVFENVVVLDKREVGKAGTHIKMSFGDGENHNLKIDAIGFSLASKVAQIEIGSRISVIAKLQENIWNGNRSVQLMLEDVGGFRKKQ